MTSHEPREFENTFTDYDGSKLIKDNGEVSYIIILL